MLRATIPTSLRQGLTTSRATSVEVAEAISTATTDGLNVPNARGWAALRAPHAGAPANALKTVTGDQRSTPLLKTKWLIATTGIFFARFSVAEFRSNATPAAVVLVSRSGS